jgi:hypothetical protein
MDFQLTLQAKGRKIDLTRSKNSSKNVTIKMNGGGEEGAH